MVTGNMNELYQFGKIGKSALYKNEHFHVMLINIPEGEELKPNSSKTDTFCIVQKGEAEFILEGVHSHVRKGDMFSFKAKQEHSLRAITDFSMLMIK